MSLLEKALEVVQGTPKFPEPLSTDSDHPADLGACLSSVFNNTKGVFEFYTPRGMVTVDCLHRAIIPDVKNYKSTLK